MSTKLRTIGSVAVALAVSLAARAQPAAPGADGQGAPPAQPSYSSAFEGYRRFSDGPVGDWREANDTVREIGGWRAYAREIQIGSRQGNTPVHEGHGLPATDKAVAPAPTGAAPHGATPAAADRPPAPAPFAEPADPHQGHHR